MALATLSIDIEARLAKLEAGMDKAQRINARTADAIEKRWQKFDAVGKTIAGTLAGAFAGAGVLSLTRNVVDGLDALNDFSDATGTTIEKASALEDVAARTGTELATVEGLLVKLNGALQQADGKNGVSRALQAIGLDAKELRQLDPAEALKRTAVALSGYADDGNKARLIQELFGKSVREAAPFLKDLAEVGELNGKVTKEQADQATRLKDQFSALQKNSLDLARVIADKLIPALNEALPKVAELFGGNKSEFTLTTEIDLMRSELAKLKKLEGEGFTVFGFFGTEEQRKAEIARIEQELATALTRLAEVRRKAGLPADVGDRTSINLGSDETKNKPKKAEEPRGIEGLPLDRYEAFRQAELQAQDTVNQAMASSLLADAEERRVALNKEIADAVQRVNNAIGATPLAKIEEAEQLLELLRAELEKTADPATIGKLREAIRITGDEIERLKNPIDDAGKQIDDFSRRAAENIQDEIGGTLYKTLTGDFDDIARNWGQLLLRMGSQAQGAQLGKYLFGDLVGGKGSGLVGEIGNLIGGWLAPSVGAGSNPIGFNGTLNNPSAYVPPITQLAEGTDRVPYDGFIAQLHKDEKVIPARYRDSSGGNAPINISVRNEAGDVAQASARGQRTGGGGADIEVMIKRIAKAAVAEDITAGGQVDRAVRGAYGVGRQTPRRS